MKIPKLLKLRKVSLKGLRLWIYELRLKRLHRSVCKDADLCVKHGRGGNYKYCSRCNDDKYKLRRQKQKDRDLKATVKVEKLLAKIKAHKQKMNPTSE